jgi:murein L,D-transpeptidase YcbB/YkuD
VAEPEVLANWVLRGEQAWTKERISAALAKTSEQQANVHKPIPVLIVYHTATVGPDGEVRFLPDVYGLEH